jgi:NitT/TauT family transport system substrate-binding protein
MEEEWGKTQDGARLPMSCLVAASDDVINDSELMEKFFEIYKSSINWVNNNPRQAAKLIEKFDIGVNAEIASDAISRCNIEFSSTENSKNEITTYLKTIFDFSPEDIGGKMPDENFYY